MLYRAWLTIAQHVFQPALTGRQELISRKTVSTNWVQGDFAKNIMLFGAKKWDPTYHDRSNSAIYTTDIYIGSTLYCELWILNWCYSGDFRNDVAFHSTMPLTFLQCIHWESLFIGKHAHTDQTSLWICLMKRKMRMIKHCWLGSDSRVQVMAWPWTIWTNGDFYFDGTLINNV